MDDIELRSPTFNSDLEWCDNIFLFCDPIDRTGMMRKVALVQGGATRIDERTRAAVNVRRSLVRAIALLILLAIAVSVGLLIGVVVAELLHQALVLIVGLEAIPDIDGTIAMRVLVFATYAIAVVAGVAVFAIGWIRLVRPRT